MGRGRCAVATHRPLNFKDSGWPSIPGLRVCPLTHSDRLGGRHRRRQLPVRFVLSRGSCRAEQILPTASGHDRRLLGRDPHTHPPAPCLCRPGCSLGRRLRVCEHVDIRFLHARPAQCLHAFPCHSWVHTRCRPERLRRDPPETTPIRTICPLPYPALSFFLLGLWESERIKSVSKPHVLGSEVALP